jgi:hypothetical protein
MKDGVFPFPLILLNPALKKRYGSKRDSVFCTVKIQRLAESKNRKTTIPLIGLIGVDINFKKETGKGKVLAGRYG